MKMRRDAALAAALALLPLLAAAPLQAQPGKTCGSGGRGVQTIDLGYDNIECNCSMRAREGDAQWSFRSEPRISGIRRGGPAEGKLRDGDEIVAVDGQLIT